MFDEHGDISMSENKDRQQDPKRKNQFTLKGFLNILQEKSVDKPKKNEDNKEKR